MSISDGLTGLYNIRYFKMLLETELMITKQGHAKTFAIIMSDIDHFKTFNDTYGHQTGDLVLREVASVLKNTARASDIVARYGGEEMIVLLRGANLKDSLKIAEKIRQNLENTSIKDPKNTYKVTASFGVSIYKPVDDVESVIKRADEGLYQAKEAGRNRVCTTESESV
jgi:diguanylate cyclase (GGDEF)-like protein